MSALPKFMTAFYKDQRIILQDGRHGKISGEMLSGMLLVEYPVILDDGNSGRFLVGDIRHEHLGKEEISAVMKNIKTQFERFSYKLDETTKMEIPNHINYLEKALFSKDKSKASREFAYVKSNIPPDEKESLDIDLDKIDWLIKRLS